MSKILHVALREFLATAATKGFIIGMLITPLMLIVVIFAMGRLMNESAPRIEGEVAVIDPTGEVFSTFRGYLDPKKIAERRKEFRELAKDLAPDEVWELAGVEESTQEALDAILGQVPQLEVVQLDDGADVELEKKPLTAGGPKDGGRLALILVHDDAVRPAEGEFRFGHYDLFVREKLDDRIDDEIQNGLRESIVDARMRRERLDRERINALTSVRRARSTTVTEGGEKATNQIFNMLLPAGFMVLLLVSVMSSGQYIMTTTIEEKSSRVVEVLLSAVSPMQLMTGKIVGQLWVGLVILALYAGMGIASLVAFALLGMVDLWLLVYLVIFFFIAFFVNSALMAAIGSAVNELREAQTLMLPVMMTAMVPWILWLPITRSPDSTFSVVLSFIPPVNTYVMMLRMTSTTPPPMWQVWTCIAIGAASVYGALWFAAKVFRIGLLMYGKPPNIATLIRWVRMA